MNVMRIVLSACGVCAVALASAAGEGARSTGALPTASPAPSVSTRRAGASPAQKMVPLVKDGAAKAAVVLAADANATERFAAEELQKWTKELTGAELQVVAAGEGARSTGALPTASPAPDLTVIRFSRQDPDVKDDGFSVTASEKEVVVAANKPVGILFGVYYLLNRFGGIYWCHPDAEADVPKATDFAIPAGRLVKHPMPFRQGMPSGNGALATPERRERAALWNVRNGFYLPGYLCGNDPEKTRPGNDYPNGLMKKLGCPGNATTGGHCLGELLLETTVDEAELKESLEWTKAHASEVLLKPKSNEAINKYARFRVLVKHHPTWFGLVDGERVIAGVSMRGGDTVKGKSSMPCLSNPEVRDQLHKRLTARIRASFPADVPVTFSLCCDDHSQWCECDNCMKLLKCKGGCDDKDKASDYWWDFINDMSARLLADPRVSLRVYVYRTYQTYPKRVKPIARDRMRIVMCPHGRCYLHSLTNPNCKHNAKYRAMLEEWTREGMPVEAFEYMCQTPGKSNYCFWEREWVKDLKWYAKSGISHGAGGLVGPWDGYWSDDGYFRRNAAKCRWQIGWLTGHFEWDPDDDFDQVRDRLFTVYYRAAAKPMKDYRALLEKAIYATGQCMPYGGGGTLFSAAAFQPGVLTKGRALLTEALALAKDDAELERRIVADMEWFHTNWESAGISGDAAAEMTRTTDKMTVDGKLDEPVWRRATVVDDFRYIISIGDTMQKVETPYMPPTALRFAFDDRNLYVAVVCTKENGKTLDIPPEGGTFDAMKGSHFALYLMSPSLGGKYFHTAISHNGKVYSALSTGGRERDLKKPLEFTHAIADAAETWTLEMAIPLKQFGAVKAGDVWKIDAARAAAGKDGRMIRGYGSLCGYGQHAAEYWKTFSFGAPANLLANGGFNDLMPPPDAAHKKGSDGLNGRGWTFKSEKVPAAWYYQQNGGIAEAKAKEEANNHYLRLQGPKRGYECFLWQEIQPYPGETKAIRFSFKARGKGPLTARIIQHPKETRRIVTQVDSVDWQEYSCEIPLGDLHPTRFLINLGAKDPIDLDDLALAPVK